MLRCFKNRCTTEKRQQLQRNFFSEIRNFYCLIIFGVQKRLNLSRCFRCRYTTIFQTR